MNIDDVFSKYQVKQVVTGQASGVTGSGLVSVAGQTARPIGNWGSGPAIAVKTSTGEWLAFMQTPQCVPVVETQLRLRRTFEQLSIKYGALIAYVVSKKDSRLSGGSLPSCGGDNRYRRIAINKCVKVCGGNHFHTLAECKNKDWYEDWPFTEQLTITFGLTFAAYAVWPGFADASYEDITTPGFSPVGEAKLLGEGEGSDPTCGIGIQYFLYGQRGAAQRIFYLPITNSVFDYDIRTGLQAGLAVALWRETDQYGAWRYAICRDGFAYQQGPPYYMLAGLRSPVISLTIDDVQDMTDEQIRNKVKSYIDGIKPPLPSANGESWGGIGSSDYAALIPSVSAATLIVSPYDPQCAPEPTDPDEVDDDDPDYDEDVFRLAFDCNHTENVRSMFRSIRGTEPYSVYIAGVDDLNIYVILKHGANNADDSKYKKIRIYTFNKDNQQIKEDVFTYPDPVEGTYRKMWSKPFLFSYEKNYSLEENADYYAQNPYSSLSGKFVADVRFLGKYYAPQGPRNLGEAEDTYDPIEIGFYEVKTNDSGGFEITEVIQTQILKNPKKLSVIPKDVSSLGYQITAYQTFVYQSR